MADDKPSRSQAILGGKTPPAKTSATQRMLNRLSLERTANGLIKATHQYRGGEGPNPEEIHALTPADFFGHLGKSFNIGESTRATKRSPKAATTPVAGTPTTTTGGR